MASPFLGRALGALATLLVLLALSFTLMRLAPGGPFDGERALPAAVEAQLRQAYRLDQPAWRQFAAYLAGLARGDLGPSFQYEGYTVAELIGAGLPVSLTLGACAILLAFVLGGAGGILAALRPGRGADHAVNAAALAAISLPAYVVAPLCILAFAVGLGWLPAGGWQPGRPSDLLLPVLALALPPAGYVARLMRASMLEALGQPWIRTARAKGLPEHVVVLRHALPAALMPVLAWLGPASAGIVTGSVVVEQIFELPGVGRHFVQGALNRDYTLVMGVVLLYGVLVVLFNLLVDLAHARLDPRTRGA